MTRILFEITNKCNLECPSCQEGRINFARAHEPFHYADLDLCKKIFKRIHDDYKESDIYLYMFCEPCLHPQLDDVLDIMDEYGLKAYISSNLNVNQDWKKLLSHPSLKRLTVSVSGITQKMYEKGQRGGRIDYVLKNLDMISKLLPEIETEIIVFFHQYTDNLKEENEFRSLCDKLRLKFVTSPAFFMYSPWTAAKHFAGEIDSTLQDGLTNTLPRLFVEKDLFMERIDSLKSVPCPLEIAEDIAIDSYGYTHPGCCLEPMSAENQIAPFCDMTKKELQKIYQTSKLCVDCKQKGFHVQFSLTPHVELTKLGTKRPSIENKQSLNEALRKFIQRNQPLDFIKTVPVHIYGVVGNAGILSLLKSQGYQVGDSIDDNPALEGTSFCGVNIRPLQGFSAEELSRACVIISFIREEEAIRSFKLKLKKMGIPHVYTLHEFFFLTDKGK